jgi:ribosome-associated translation inhibitor RaiA
MIRIHFKGLRSSSITREAVEARVKALADRFPALRSSPIQLTLEMENSPHKAGADVFTVHLFVRAGRYRGLKIVKSASTLYLALAELVDPLLEAINRTGDRRRVRRRTRARRWKMIPRLAPASGGLD